MSGSLKHDRFHPLKRKTMQNASWTTTSTTCQTNDDRTSSSPSDWPLQFTLKDQTRAALFREFGLKETLRPSLKLGSKSSSLLRLQKASSRILSLSNSQKDSILRTAESRMLPLRSSATTTTSREEEALLQDAKSFSSTPNCGGLRRSCHLSSLRSATVVPLNSMKRNSIFREAIKQQQSS